MNLMAAKITLESVSSDMWSIWFLLGAAFVFWMQAGFAMVESGFTRAKNAGNIIMKNLMDFCIGTVMWFLIGASLMMAAPEGSKDFMGIMGTPGFGVFTDYKNFSYSGFVFNLMFCATTATIVSGAVAERTKFSAYLIYSAIISGIIYPIEAHWTWGGGFLAQMGFHDYAGSNCIHMVGGICALVGAAFVGPRIGKFKKKDGKVVKVNAIPGHNIVIGALGVFILWLGWYGFNGAAATDVPTLGSVFLTTTVAPAVATVVTMIFTWIKYGKPDVSMTLNAALAGLVAITAPCDVTDCAGAAIIGLVSGFLVVFGVWFLDYKLHIDDPVGAVAVHMMNGIWGTIAVGLFATASAPGFKLAGISEGLFYGGGFKQLGLQLVGMFITAAWAVVTIVLVFYILKKTIGIRATAEEEIAGMDIAEHGLDSAYADFAQLPTAGGGMESTINTVDHDTVVAKDTAVPVIGNVEADDKTAMYKVSILCKQSRFEDLKDALNAVDVTGITMTQVLGCGVQKGNMAKYYRGAEVSMILLPKVKVEVVISKVPVKTVVDAAVKALYTGHIGDGKIFVYKVENAIKVRTGEQGYDALQGSAEDYF